LVSLTGLWLGVDWDKDPHLLRDDDIGPPKAGKSLVLQGQKKLTH
jgi:hypothetical protein